MEHTEPILIRIDDIGAFDPTKDCLIEQLCAAGLAVTCAVVPLWVEPAGRDFLRGVARRYPGKLEIHQHGYAHKNYSDGRYEYEFGPRRSLEQQLHDISAGRQLLERAFGDLFFPAFTPPYSSFDRNTLTALKQAGFQAVSGLTADGDNPYLPNLCPDIDCFTWHPTRELAWEEVAAAWRAGQPRALRGLILHPHLMRAESVQAYAEAMPRLLPAERCALFADLVRCTAQSTSIGGIDSIE
jgi:hypothetical protein